MTNPPIATHRCLRFVLLSGGIRLPPNREFLALKSISIPKTPSGTIGTQLSVRPPPLLESLTEIDRGARTLDPNIAVDSGRQGPPYLVAGNVPRTALRFSSSPRPADPDLYFLSAPLPEDGLPLIRLSIRILFGGDEKEALRFPDPRLWRSPRRQRRLRCPGRQGMLEEQLRETEALTKRENFPYVLRPNLLGRKTQESLKYLEVS